MRRALAYPPGPLPLFLLLVGLFYAPILLGTRTLAPGDFTEHFLPFALFQQKALLGRYLPLWNPYTYGGHPFLADVQAAVYYPVSNLLLLLTLPWQSAASRLYWLEMEAAVHLLLGGIFTYLLARDLTGSRAAGFLSGCAFAFSGYLTGYPPLQLAVLRTAIWLPLVLWFLWRGATRAGNWLWWLAAATAYAISFLAGHAQTFYLGSQIVLGWAFLLFVTAPRRKEGGLSRRALVARIAAFYVLFLGLSAAQLWPSLEFTRLSVRASVDYEFLSGGFPVQDTWQLLLPGVLTLFSPLYISVVGLGLACLALAGWWVGRRAGEGSGAFPAAVPFFGVAGIFYLLLSYGDNGFLYPLLYRWVPTWRMFRGQERAAYIVTFSLCVLAGYGVVALFALASRTRRRVALLFVVAVSAGIVLFALFWQMPGRTDVMRNEFLRIALTVWLSTLAGAWLVASDRLARWRSAGLTVLVVADLFLANASTNLVPQSPAAAVAEPEEVTALAEAVEAGDAAALGVPGRTYNEFRVYGNFGMRAGVEEVWGQSPLYLARYATLFDEFPLDRMWRLTGVQHVLTWREALFGPTETLATFPRESDASYIHRLPVRNPRAWIVPEVRVAEDDEAARLLADHAFDLERSALLAPEDGDLLTGARGGVLSAPGANEVVLERLSPGHLRAEVTSEQGGWLVVSENWMPGWRAILATPDGAREDARVGRSNLTFLGLPLPPGESTVELIYDPASVRVGLLVSVLTLALIAVLVLGTARAHVARLGGDSSHG